MQQHQKQEEFGGGFSSGRRSVSEILARRSLRESASRRQLFPPDFLHGEAALAEIYEVLGAGWVERAIFVAGADGVASVAYFDDYFLVVEQWTEEDEESWDLWWEKRLGSRDRVIALVTEDNGPLEALQALGIKVSRDRLLELEQALLGVVRDGLVQDLSLSGRLRQSQIDVLSLLTLTSRLSDEADAA